MLNDYSPRQRAALIRCFAAYFISGAGSLLLGSLLPYLRMEYGLSYEVSGLLVSAQSTGNLIANILSGMLPFILGRRRGTLVLVCWLGVGYLIVTLFGAPVMLVLGCFLMGISRGGMVNFGNITVGNLAKDPSRMLNLNHGVFALGCFLSPFVLLGFVTFGGGFWRGATIAIVILGAVQFWLISSMDREFSDPPASKKSGKADYRVFRSKLYWCAAAILVTYIAAEYTINGWLVSYLRDSGLLPESVAQMMSSIMWLLMLTGRLLVARFGGRISGHKLLIVSGMGFVGFFMLILFSSTPALVVTGVVLMGFFMSPIYPTAMGGVSKEIGDSDLAMAGLVTIAGIGGIFMPYVVGFVAERSGMMGGMMLVLVTAVLNLLVILINGVMRRKKGTAEQAV